MMQTLDEQDILRKYLLHDLGEAEEEQVELTLLTDKEFGRRLAIAEHDLLDDFVASRLSEPELESFREHYMTTPQRLQKLKFAKALDRHVSTTFSSQPAGPFEKLLAFFRTDPLKAAFSVTGSLLIFGAALFIMFRMGWFQSEQGHDLREEFSRVNRAQETDSVPLSELKRNSGNTVALMLTQNLVREDGEVSRVEITRNVRLIRLLLEVSTGSFASYKVVLQNVDRQEFASVGNLKARSEEGTQYVVINVPAEFLNRGDYQMRLIGISRDGQETDVGVYPFQATR